jgi:hypothetical protein
VCVCVCYGAVIFSSALLKFPINLILGVSDHTEGDYIFFFLVLWNYGFFFYPIISVFMFF